MDALVTMLNPEQDERIFQIWNELKAKCGLTGIEKTPIPHFSWSSAENFNLPEIDQFLAEFAASASVFEVATAGLGLFLTPEPVVYIPVIKSKDLFEMHTQLWENVSGLGYQLNPLYTSESWVPHITLAQWRLTKDSIACSVQHLASLDLSMKIRVDNLAVICQQGGKVGAMHSQFKFRN